MRGVPVASIHDLGLVPLASDAIIDGSIVAAAGDFPRRDAALFLGTPYLVLSDSCVRFHSRPRQIRPRISKVVINLGGGDGSRFFRKILAALHSSGLPLDVVGMPGFSSWGQADLAQMPWDPLRFRWASPEEDPIGLMYQADLAITGGGLAAYEALCVGTPLCALSYDQYQKITVDALARTGACLDLGLGKPLRSARVCAQFRKLDGNQELRFRLSEQGRRTVDGRGAQRVARIVRRLIADRAPEGAASLTL
jgi:spore coat polysaccharide biosynthesis predicted glycosyltransferase SpsG